MSNRKSLFKQSDVTRALNAGIAAGLDKSNLGFKIAPDGSIVVWVISQKRWGSENVWDEVHHGG